MEQNEKNKQNNKKLLIILGVVALLVGLFMIFPLLFHEEKEKADVSVPTPPAEEEAVELTISAVGDVMVHKPQIPAQYNSTNGTYQFDNNFSYIKKYIEGADLALCNLETTFAGGHYSGYPVFNAPESLADALKTAGFDVALTANNHIMDMGLDGMKRTLEVTRNAGLETAGTRLSGEKTYSLVKAKGVNIGIVAYAYETPSIGGQTTVNGNSISDEAIPLLNTFSYETLEDDLARIQKSIQEAREDGAELVICYFHWGEEYQRSPNEYQQYIARQAASYGADIIFASHPHVLQGVELLTDEESGRQVPVFYSMGNLISNQRTETLDNRYTEQGIIAEVQLQYLKSTQEILSMKMDAIPLWVDKYHHNGKDIYTVIPLDDQLSENPDLAVSGHFNRAEQALRDIRDLLGDEYIRTNE